MAGLKGKSGPPGNMNAFKHGLAAVQKRGITITSSSDEFFYHSQGASIRPSETLLPFSERSGINSELLCHRCLAQA